MKNKFFKTLSSFRFRSIFVTIACSLFGVCIIISIVFSIIFSKTIVSNNQEALLQSNQEYLQTVVRNIDYLLQTLQQTQTQLSYSSNTLGLIFSKSPDAIKISNIKLDLIHLADNTPLIREAFLYVPSFDMVISSDKNGSSQSLSDYRYSGFVEDYQMQFGELTKLYSNQKQSTIFVDENDLILVRDFPLSGDSRLASLYYVIELSELDGILSATLPEFNDLIVIDQNNVSLLHPENSLSRARSGYIFPEDMISGDHCKMPNGSICFYQISDYTSWQYFYIVDSALLHISFRQILPLLVPILITFLLVSVLMSYFVACLVYRPVRKLYDTVDIPDAGAVMAENPHNELDYFRLAYQENTQKRKELKSVLSTISYDTTSRIFHDLIADTISNVEKRDLPDLLNTIGSPYREDNLYRIYLVEFGREYVDIEKEKIHFLNSLKQTAAALDIRYDSHSHVLMMHGLVFCVILSFPKDTLIITLNNAKQEFLKAVSEYAAASDCSAGIGIGHTYHSVFDLKYAYKDAMEDLRKHQKGSANTDSSADIPFRLPEEITDMDIQIYSQHLIDAIEAGDEEEAARLSNHVLLRISGFNEPAGFAAEKYNMYFDTLLEKISGLKYTENLPVSSEAFTKIFCSDEEPLTGEGLFQKASGLNATLLRETFLLMKKQKNHYLLSAQEYISAHYQNPNLSLNSVAAAIDINSSYLSRLFKNNIGIKFTDYITKIRIEESIRLLVDTQKSVKEISEETGFNSVQNFIRVFKKVTDSTPKQYRTAACGKSDR